MSVRRLSLLRLIPTICACVLLVFSVPVVAAQQEGRVALVIGNNACQHLPVLQNPANDAQLIAATLQSLGFRLIGGRAQIDLDRRGFEGAIRQFGAALAGGSVGLFYYAGHGIAVQGVNYLVPISANPQTAADADLELIGADIVLKQMEGAASRLNIMILDACRNNPFGGRGLRDAGQGLAIMRAPRGTVISYATQPGNVAMDGQSGHSPYTAALADAMRRPGIALLEVFNAVGLAVDRATGGRQQPWMASSPLEGAFYFLSPTTVNIAPPLVDAETVFWQTMSQSSNPADFEEYLRQYPQGRFAALARNRLAMMPPTSPASGPAPANPGTPQNYPPQQAISWRFDDNYAGSRKEPELSVGKHHHHPDCPGAAPVTMTIRGGHVTFVTSGGEGGTKTYIGSVNTEGEVAAFNYTYDGRIFPISGAIRDNAFTGKFSFGRCSYDAELVRQ